MPANVLLKALGLNTSINQLDTPPGSMIEASNIVIKDDNIITSRRGFKIFGETFGSSSDRTKQLFSYRNRILRHYSDKIEFETGELTTSDVAIFDQFSGSFSETETGLRIKSIESNGNLYFTTSDGIQKLSTKTADEFTTSSNYIKKAGGLKAVDLTAEAEYNFGDQTSFLPQDSAVAYRILWSEKDANSNLVSGTPSQRAEVYNSLLTILLQDYNIVLQALDYLATGSLITDGDYVSLLGLPITSSASELYTFLLSLSIKIDTDIKYADEAAAGSYPLNISAVSVTSNVVTITFSSGDPQDYFITGSDIEISGFTDNAAASLDGFHSLTAVTPTTISFNYTSANGAGSVSGSAYIRSNEFRSISPVPDIPSTPATNAELVAIQDYLNEIIIQLQSEPTATISSGFATLYLDNLDITTSSKVSLEITIPADITSNHYYQIYRSDISQATDVVVLTDLTPNDEMKLVYEAYPTSDEISARKIEIDDITPDVFRGANLYSNEITGEGISQANDLPPFAKDINRFKSYTFYANTKTLHRSLLSLLGVVNMITDYNNNITPKLIITDGDTSNTYTFVIGKTEKTKITCNAGSTLVNTGMSDYFLINSANNKRKYYVWFKIGTSVDPSIADRIGIPVISDALDTDTQLATKLKDTLASYIGDFEVTISTNEVTIENIEAGYTDDTADGSTGFIFTVLQDGIGEDATLKQVLLSDLVSVGQAVDETARSLVRVINENSSEIVNAFYLSTANSVPGQILLEARELTNKFYLLGNNSNTGTSFNPDLSPEVTISNISVANPTVITTSTSHGLVNGDQVIIIDSDSTPSIDGLYDIIYVSPTTFKIDVNVTVLGTTGSLIKTSNAVFSDNEEKPNRIYYSKYQQPDAVPLVNFFDVGSQDKKILRIFPLKDSLFVFKEDGLFRVSGETAPFVVSLFDSSYVLLAPDSLAVANNIVYGWTTQGISIVSEGGTQVITRNIDNIVKKLGSSNFPSFKTATWGIGYESDNSYIVFTIGSEEETSPTVGYRFDQGTRTWTTIDKDYTCGVIHSNDDKMYVGAGDTNSIEQERKLFQRTDFSDRELNFDISAGNFFNTVLKFGDVSDLDEGDVLVQEQRLTIYQFNQILKKLDTDSGIHDTDYFSTLQATSGLNFRTRILELAAKLDLDTGVQDTNYESSIETKSGTITAISIANPSVITTSSPHGLVTGRIVSIGGSNSSPTINDVYPVTVIDASNFSIPIDVDMTAGTTGTFSTVDTNQKDIQVCYNHLIAKLNSDILVNYGNYSSSEGITIQECIIDDVNITLKQITVNLDLPYTEGPVIIYKSIPTSITYCPITFDDPLSLKHIREATMMFSNKAFTDAEMSFATDLLPEFKPVPVIGDGNGIFGFSSFGEGFFGGGSHGAPFRTLIPLDKARCRYLVIKFTHMIAREQFEIYGMTLLGEVGLSSRAYR